mmetsp:Transcript_33203/g.109436  ORF Transcript_33203/g.109436 Transcript_33203/m.109436 type:complete len:92 (+) Transcript_33203:310-585(+)
MCVARWRRPAVVAAATVVPKRGTAVDVPRRWAAVIVPPSSRQLDAIQLSPPRLLTPYVAPVVAADYPAPVLFPHVAQIDRESELHDHHRAT